MFSINNQHVKRGDMLKNNKNMLTTILILNFTFPIFQKPNLEFTIFQQHVLFQNNQHVKVSNMLKEVTC